MLATARQIYSAVIRLAMTHGAVAWHMGPDAGVERAACQGYKNSPVKKLACLTDAREPTIVAGVLLPRL